ncbi:MAG: hypothetical protein AB1489_08990 [Acidobacteriota bacterium]
MGSKFNLAKVGIALLVGIYFAWCAIAPFQWRLIDGVNLFVHEAGHLVFSPLGEFFSVLGGSLIQVIMPTTFVAYFIYQEDNYSGALTVNWVGQNLLNISVYAGDAVAMQLPLVGNGDRIHDWNYILTELGLLNYTPRISLVIRLLGTLTIIAATLFALYSSRIKEESARE